MMPVVPAVQAPIQTVAIDWDSLPFEFGYERLKKYLRIFDDSANSEHRDTIELLVRAAVEAIEKETRQTFVRKTLRSVYKSIPAIIQGFPVVSLTRFEWFNGSVWAEVATVNTEIEQEFANWTSGDWIYYLDNSQPARILGQNIELAQSYRFTWEAGYSIWPKDLTLLVCQLVAENFDEPGATSKQIHFTKSHERTLEHYRTHHDALRWA